MVKISGESLLTFFSINKSKISKWPEKKICCKTNTFGTRKSLGANWFPTIYCVVSQVNKYAITQCHSPIKMLSEACWRHCKQISRWENLFLFSKQKHPLKPLPFCAEKCGEWFSWWRHTGGVNMLAPGVFSCWRINSPCG